MAALEAIGSADTRTMVSHVWLTAHAASAFVRWLMAEDSFRSWSRMAALILFSLSLSSALTDFSWRSRYAALLGISLGSLLLRLRFRSGVIRQR